MKRKLLLVLFLAISLLFLFSFDNVNVYAKENKKEEKIYSEATINDEFSDDSLIVVLKESASKDLETLNISDFNEIDGIELKDLNKSSLKKLKEENKEIKKNNRILSLKIKNKGKKEVLKAIKKLEKRDDVLYVGPDYTMKIATDQVIPNDKYFDEQNELQNMQFPEAWKYSVGHSSIKVGVIDTGIDITHPDLVGKVDTELSEVFVNTDSGTDAFYDGNGHGTHVAGIIGANMNNDIGIAGACPFITLVSLKAFNSSGNGKASNVIQAISHATSNNIPILNISAANTLEISDSDITGMEMAISNYKGLVICAAGNDTLNLDNLNGTVLPASLELDNLITVGNLKPENVMSETSNYGKNKVDLFAIGHEVLSTFPKTICNSEIPSKCISNLESGENVVVHPYFVYERGYHTISGTSQACPFVTATAALLLSKDETLSPKLIKLSILENVDKVSTLTGKCATGGRLNTYKAITNGHIHSFTYSYGIDSHEKSCECGYTTTENHNLTFIKDDSLTHTGYCYDCGYVTESQSHSLSNGTCSICTAHFHSLSGCTCIYCGLKSHIVAFKYLNNFSHSGKCRKCKTTITEPHVILAEDIGKSTATCQGCFELLDLSQDIVTTYSLRRNLILTDNGSYMMSNGIIVLIGNDVIKYKKGELSFS